MPHIGKDAMIRAGVLPTRIEASDRAVEVFYFATEGRPILREGPIIDDDDNKDGHTTSPQHKWKYSAMNRLSSRPATLELV